MWYFQIVLLLVAVHFQGFDERQLHHSADGLVSVFLDYPALFL
ncbi:hypothetical protein B4092_3862 [Bacillus licheniformis]|nr:hypothetical protein B4092_3862 [Bacillus licheniformis]